MNTETLDIRTKLGLVIKADLGKNFSVEFEGFDNLDIDYTLTLVSKNNKESTNEFTLANGDIVLDPANKKLTLVFEAVNYACGSWVGVLESVNKNDDFFYSNEITLIIE